MGQVFLADGPLGPVAVKVIRSDIADEPVFHSRFRREVQACFRVSGPATARLLDFDLDADPPWLATEFFDAPHLGRMVQLGGPLGEPAQLGLAAGLAEALVSIHGAGLVHRDLKPSNVMCALDGPRVIDFGVATADDNRSLTATGAVVGTPGWLAPEQVADGDATTASDVFAVGGLISYAATGRPPYGTGPTPAVLLRIATETPRIDDPRLSPALRGIVSAAFARAAADRPSARELRDAILEAAGAAGAGGGTIPGAPATLVGLLERGWHVPPIPPDLGPTPGAAGGADATSPGRGAQMPPPSPPPPPPPPPAMATTLRATPPSYSTPARPDGTPGAAAAAANPGPGPDGGGDERGDGASGRRRGRRRRLIPTALGATAVIAAGIVVAVVLLGKGGGDKNTFTADGPWRLHIEDNQTGNDVGCTIKLTNTDTDTPVTLPGPIYERSSELQLAVTGSFSWSATNDCLVLAEDGPGETSLPFSQTVSGDTLAFHAPASGRVTFTVRDFNGGSSCDFATFDPDGGQQLDTGEATPDASTATLSTGDRPTVYASLTNSCKVTLSAAS